MSAAVMACIERGIPIPKRRGGTSRGDGYQFESMIVGDSFFVAGVNAVHRLSSAARDFRRRHAHLSREFFVQATECDPVYKTHGARVWRVK